MRWFPGPLTLFLSPTSADVFGASWGEGRSREKLRSDGDRVSRVESNGATKTFTTPWSFSSAQGQGEGSGEPSHVPSPCPSPPTTRGLPDGRRGRGEFVSVSVAQKRLV